MFEMNNIFKSLLKKIMYPHKYSNERYISFLRSKGCKIGEGTFFTIQLIRL